MFQVTANPDKMRLYVTMSGHLEPAERREVAKAVMAGMKELGPGFDIVHDMTGLLPTDPEGLKELVRIQAAAKIMGVRLVVRIVKIPLVRRQFERVAQETGWTFELAGSLEEADARLDQLAAALEEAGNPPEAPGPGPVDDASTGAADMEGR